MWEVGEFTAPCTIWSTESIHPEICAKQILTCIWTNELLNRHRWALNVFICQYLSLLSISRAREPCRIQKGPRFRWTKGGWTAESDHRKISLPFPVLYPGNITAPQSSITAESICFCSPFAQLLLCNLGQSFWRLLNRLLMVLHHKYFILYGKTLLCPGAGRTGGAYKELSS